MNFPYGKFCIKNTDPYNQPSFLDFQQNGNVMLAFSRRNFEIQISVLRETRFDCKEHPVQYDQRMKVSTRPIKCVEKYETSKRKNAIQKALGHCRKFRNCPFCWLSVTVLSSWYETNKVTHNPNDASFLCFHNPALYKISNKACIH